MPTVYEILCAIAEAHPESLVAYGTDLHKCDRELLERSKAGEEYVWILRKHGTELFPIRAAHEPVSVTYWLQPGVFAFHVRIAKDSGAAGTAVEISHEEATRLAHLPPPAGARLWAPAGFALLLRQDGHDIGRVTNSTGLGWDAEVLEYGQCVGRFDSADAAMGAVERSITAALAA